MFIFLTFFQTPTFLKMGVKLFGSKCVRQFPPVVVSEC